MAVHIDSIALGEQRGEVLSHIVLFGRCKQRVMVVAEVFSNRLTRCICFHNTTYSSS
jgi:hypothetical protein